MLLLLLSGAGGGTVIFRAAPAARTFVIPATSRVYTIPAEA